MEVAAAWGRAFAIPSRSAIASEHARERQEEAGVARVRRDAKPPPEMQDAGGVAAGARGQALKIAPEYGGTQTTHSVGRALLWRGT